MVINEGKNGWQKKEVLEYNIFCFCMPFGSKSMFYGWIT